MPDLSYLLGRNSSDRFDLTPEKQTMKAVITTGNGGYDKLEYRDVPIPELQAGEVLVKVRAAGVNNTEINTRLGWYSETVDNSTEGFADDGGGDDDLADGGWNQATPFPFIQGTDCCGTVVAHADGVQDRWQVVNAKRAVR